MEDVIEKNGGVPHLCRYGTPAVSIPRKSVLPSCSAISFQIMNPPGQASKPDLSGRIFTYFLIVEQGQLMRIYDRKQTITAYISNVYLYEKNVDNYMVYMILLNPECIEK